jgi:hypothetical protein
MVPVPNHVFKVLFGCAGVKVSWIATHPVSADVVDLCGSKLTLEKAI